MADISIDTIAQEILCMVASLSGNVVNNRKELEDNLALKAAIVGHLTLRFDQIKQREPGLMGMMADLARQMGMQIQPSDIPVQEADPEAYVLETFKAVHQLPGDTVEVKRLKFRLNGMLVRYDDLRLKYDTIVNAIGKLYLSITDD